MPSKKPEPKKASEMTTEELARRVFPQPVIDEIRRAASEPPKRGGKPNKSSQ
jgi:hypothetical protein